MRHNPHILYFGEGTGERGGTFAHTKGLWQEFGGARMVDTPISEQGFTGAAIGASATGTRTIADLMFADFIFEAAGQIVLQAAKLHYMSNGQMNAPMVVRVGSGALRSAGPHHSGCYHPMWAHVPGLIVCMPSNPADAKGLMKTALRASNPVIMLETKALFASKGEVPAGEHLVPFGVARVVRRGRDLTIVSAGQLLHRALEAAEAFAAEGDRMRGHRSPHALPLDVTTVAESVARTHRLLVVDEGYAMCGIGAEIAQAMNELVYDELDGAGRPAAHRSVHPPVRARARARDAHRFAEHRRRRARRDGGHARRCEPLADAGAEARAATAVGSPRRSRLVNSCHPSRKPSPRSTASRSPCRSAISPSARADRPLGEGGRRKVRQGELIAEIETDKAVVEIEAPCTGVLARIEQPAGAVVKMGGRIGSCDAGMTCRSASHHVAGGPAAIDRERVAIDVGARRATRGTAPLARSPQAGPAGPSEYAPSRQRHAL